VFHKIVIGFKNSRLKNKIRDSIVKIGQKQEALAEIRYSCFHNLTGETTFAEWLFFTIYL
jgi:hypothetical protein